MINLPSKYSKKWLYIMAALFLLTFSALIIVGVILKMSIGLQNIGGFALLSFVLAIIIGGGGFLGAKAYFYTAFIFDILGIIYMIYVVVNKTADGWSDLVSIISYLFIVGVGILLGLVIQGVSYFVSKRKR